MLLGGVVVVPICIYFSRAFDNGGSSIRDMLDTPGFAQTLMTTLFFAAASTFVAAVIAVIMAALIMRVEPRWRGVASFIPQLPLVVPPLALVYGFIFLFAPRTGYANAFLRGLPFVDDNGEGPLNIYSMTGMVLIQGLEAAAIMFAMVYARMQEISGSLVAAARMSGAGAFRAFYTVTLPLLRPALVSAIVVAFLLGLGSFTAPLLLGSPEGIHVITTEVFRVREQFPIDYGLTAAFGLPLLVVGIASIVVQRVVIGDQRRYTTHSTGRGMHTGASFWALMAVVGYGVVTVLLPLLAVVVVAFSPYWTGDLSSVTFTLGNFEAVFSNRKVPKAITTSLVTSVLALVIVLPLAFISALALAKVVKVPRFVQVALDYIFIAPLAVPRAMLGMVVLFVFIRPPFSLYGSLALFVIGYAFIVLPFSMRSQLASLIGVHGSLFEAARISGASQSRMVLDIALPLARRGIAASMAIGFILLAHDFAVAVMVRSPGNQVMGTLLYELGETGAFPEIAVMSMLITAVTATGLAITVWLGGRKSLENL